MFENLRSEVLRCKNGLLIYLVLRICNDSGRQYKSVYGDTPYLKRISSKLKKILCLIGVMLNSPTEENGTNKIDFCYWEEQIL